MESIRLGELVGAMSIATDLAMNQPIESGLESCRVAVRLAEAMGLSDEEVGRVFHLSLLRHIGCTAGNFEEAGRFGDEVTLRTGHSTLDFASPRSMLPYMLRHIRQTYAPLERPLALVRVLAAMGTLPGHAVEVCEVADMLAERLGFDKTFRSELFTVGERWDGKGFPGRRRGDELSPTVRVVQVAETASAFNASGGVEAAVEVVRSRSGSMFDPATAERFSRDGATLLAESSSTWDEAMAFEPTPHEIVEGDGLDRALRAMADFTDLKSPYTTTHSSGVAELAEAAGRRAGIPDDDAIALRRAGLLHDLGRVAVSAGVWGKRGPLTRSEWENVRLHPYHTARVLARPAFLAGLGAVASMHHERLDGSGYFRGAPAASQPPAARILAAADVYHALMEPRPHRPALEADRAATEIKAEVKAGRLDADAVAAVLEAAGGRPAKRRAHPSGLTAREIDVLRLLARGRSIKEVARELQISPKTADAHIQHIYTKAGVSTRAAATLFAMQHDLIAASSGTSAPER